MKAFVAVDENGDEWVYERMPNRQERGKEDCWCTDDDSLVELPKGSIKKLIGRRLTWEDEPVELKEEA